MKLLFDEYFDILYEALISLFIILSVVFILSKNVAFINTKYLSKVINPITITDRENIETIEEFSVSDAVIKINEDFEYQKYIKAINKNGEDISSYVTLLNSPDTSKEAVEDLIYLLRYNGQTIAIKSKLIITNKGDVI